MNKNIIILFAIFNFSIFSQNSDSLYTLSADFGIGYSRYITTLENDDLNLNGFNSSFRIMWHPEHLLSLGLETGYNNLYSLETIINVPGSGSTTATVSMNAIPILICFDMIVFPKSLPGLRVNFSSGAILLNNSAGAFVDYEFNSSQMSLGYSAATTYMHPLSDNISIGAKLGYTYISKIQDSNIALQLFVSYDFMHW